MSIPTAALDVSVSLSEVPVNETQAELVAQCVDDQERIKILEEAFEENGIEIPRVAVAQEDLEAGKVSDEVNGKVLADGSVDAIRNLLEQRKHIMRNLETNIEFHNLRYSTKVNVKRTIPTVGTLLTSLLCWWKCFPEEKEIDILAEASGRIASKKLTLLIGPPGSGKSVLLKAFGGKLAPTGKAKLSGEVYFDGDNIRSGKFLPSKVADYVEQGDTHEAILTVEETLKFAWMCTTAGRHSYGNAHDETSAAKWDEDNEEMIALQNTITMLGLKGCKDTCVGNAMIRGVSGGQKRRVTIGEMMVCPRPIKLMDCISNGLDTATTVDIVNAIRVITHTVGLTTVISLLQPPPDVFNLFDEVILLSEGHIIYHGPRDQIVSYFEQLGYRCPDLVDEADFLQELPTPEGRKYIVKPVVPHTSSGLARAWQSSELYKQMVAEMRYPSLDDAKALSSANTKQWYQDYTEQFASNFWFYLDLCVTRQFQVVFRNTAFVKARIIQNMLVGAIAGSLFNNIGDLDTPTMNGFLFNITLTAALNNFSMLPIIYDQKRIYYKQKDASFFPTVAFTFAQAIAFLPLQIIESLVYVSIVYWSAGLSSDHNGSRFLTFMVMHIAFGVTYSQLFRLTASLMADINGALPFNGILLVVAVLFSGFIQPKAVISNGWIWFYWMNPLAWALKAVTINEFTSPKYNFDYCLNPDCTETKRYGDYVLDEYGNPTNQRWIWYSFAVLIAEFIFMFACTVLAMKYIRTVPTPPAPIRIVPEDEEKVDLEAAQAIEKPVDVEQLPFDLLSFAFRDITYTVTLANGEDVDLLKGVSGHFQPGSITALMGATGAGKTTLLDVLAGRKNTGVVKGDMYVNGVPKVDAYFRKVTAYVEQFDTLPRKSTAREAIAFSAALRLTSSITQEQREMWVDSVLEMMDLQSLENDLIGILDAGGMSFEQRKRVSIGVELASNPSILFLDEPTTGLDSRAAQILVHNIRTIASTGRSVVCTIHQPSTVIFNAFDSLLLLMRGGQTVYFGELGLNAKNMIDYFQAAPGVAPIGHHVNPATWMLEVIGAGTTAATNDVNFHDYYRSSALCEANQIQLEGLSRPLEGSKRLTAEDMEDRQGYNASSWTQFSVLMHRFALTQWRSPMYTALRPLVNTILALIFASAYPLYKYHTYVRLISRTAVMYVTTLFCGILAIIMVVPMAQAERPLFYKEQQCRMYSVPVYALAMFLIELPGLIIGALTFTIPFFYIVNFESPGDEAQKFCWYWFFNFLLQATLLYLGHFYSSLTPNEATSHVIVGLNNTVLSLFCGFLITEAEIPDFWLFMYWLNPQHFALEGLLGTQFKDDHTLVETSDGSYMTAVDYLTQVRFTRWKYGHVGWDVLGLCLLIFGAVVSNYLCLAYMRHDKR